MDLAEQLAAERRARLAAELLLTQKRTELAEANSKISAHAKAISGELIEQREEARLLHGRHQVDRENLERARSETGTARRRLWDSIETIKDGFAVFDRDQKLVIANKAYTVVFDGLEDIRPGVTYDQILRLAAEEGVFDIGRLSRDDWIAMMLVRRQMEDIEPIVLQMWNGQFVRLIERRTAEGDTVTLALNITEAIERENELNEARLKAEAASRAKSAFLANMSHEIRTPMNGVVAMAELLTESSLDEEQTLYVETIRSSAEALLVIINDVLDFSKIEAEKLILHPKPFDLERTIYDVLMLLQPTARGKDVQLITDFDTTLPQSVVGDPGRIRQVLTNLIGNAVKFTTSGHVLVKTVGSAGPAPDTFKVFITVEDTGIGIPPDKLDHIFGEFNQAEDEMSRSFDGTGLGLSITQKLISMMGGEIWVDSEVGSGSSFGFHISLGKAEDTSVPATPPLPGWIEQILCFDPDDVTSSVLTKHLATERTKVGFCSTVEELCAAASPKSAVVLSAHSEQAEQIYKRLSVEGISNRLLLIKKDNQSFNAQDDANVASLRHPLLRGDISKRLAALQETTAKPKDTALDDRPEHTPHADPDIEVAPAINEVAREEPPEPSIGPRKLRVLAAEDNKTNRLVFSKLIKALNIDLVFAENGKEAVDISADWAPDILFTDISMPEMDGKEAARTIRLREKELGQDRLLIVAMTAHAMAEDAEEILKAGIDGYLTKPLKKQEIIDQILSVESAGIEPVLPEIASQKRAAE